MYDGLKSMMKQKDFILLLIIFFVGLGMFNGVTTWIEEIIAPRGFSRAQAGTAGGLMLIGGIVGAFVLPLISDSLRRRKPFVLLALVGLLPGLAGLAFARSYGSCSPLRSCSGFFLLSAGPIGFQYGAEVTLPAPEGTSNSMLVVMGQVSGILFIFAMDAFKAPDGSMTASLAILFALTVASFILALFLRSRRSIGGWKRELPADLHAQVHRGDDLGERSHDSLDEVVARRRPDLCLRHGIEEVETRPGAWPAPFAPCHGSAAPTGSSSSRTAPSRGPGHGGSEPFAAATSRRISRSSSEPAAHCAISRCQSQSFFSTIPGMDGRPETNPRSTASPQ